MSSRGRAVVAGLAGLLAEVLAGLAPPAAAAAAAPPCATPHWVSAFALSPSDDVTSTVPVDETLRQQVYPHVGGTAVRVHLSNRLFGGTGIGTVTFGAASIGIRSSGPALVAGSVRPLTFGGRPTLTLGPNDEAISDPAPLTVTAFGELEVSLFVSTATGMAAEHVLATQSSYMTAPGAGDHTADTDGAAFTVVTPLPGEPVALPQNVDYLDRVDVLAPGSVGTVVAFGDSITDGFEGNLSAVNPSPLQLDLNSRYPDDLARRLAAAGRPLGVVDAGISGNKLLADASTPIFGPSGLHRLAADGLAQPGATTVLLLEGINDFSDSSVTAAAMQAGDTAFVAAVHQAGLRVLLATLTPDDGTLQNGYGTASDPQRAALNAWIRGQHIADGVVDFDAAVRDPASPGQINPAYDGGDHLHFNAAGYVAMAAAVPLDLLADVACSGPAAAPRPSPAGTTAAVRAPAPVAGSLSLGGRGTAVAGAIVRPTQVTGRLAFTGSGPGAPLAGLAALLGLLALRWRRRLR